MPLQNSSFPIPETRFFKAERFIFRFKIKGGTSFSREETYEDDGFNHEMEHIIRTVIGNLDNLQPFCTNRYIIFPYKKCWEVRENMFGVYPYTIVLYVEKNTARKKEETRNTEGQHVSYDEPPVKRSRRDSPLEEAILFDLLEDMAAEPSVTKKDDAGQHGKLEDMDPAPDQKQRPEKKETTVRPGILTRLARRVFPFFFKSPTVQIEE